MDSLFDLSLFNLPRAAGGSLMSMAAEMFVPDGLSRKIVVIDFIRSCVGLIETWNNADAYIVVLDCMILQTFQTSPVHTRHKIQKQALKLARKCVTNLWKKKEK